MERFSEFFKNLGGFIGRMSPGQVMMLLGVTAGSIVGMVFVVGWLTDLNYSRLYGNLQEDEAGEIVAYLNDNKIPFQLSDGGRTISVPSADVYRTRISVASEGLPRSGYVGYSIFDDNNLGMTDFLQNLNMRRALEGELTRTIMQLNAVQAARVHIVMPKERLFRDDQHRTTASVVLKLKSKISKRQVQGISHLVASSVEGLVPENITIVDYGGNLLTSAMASDALAGLSSSQLEMRMQVESYLEHKAQSMLDDVLGVGKSVIRVTASLNFEQVERTSETYDANAPSIRSEERTKTIASYSDKEGEDGESTRDDNTESFITNYELNKSVEHIVSAVGTIERLSVAVMVDGVYEEVEGADGVIELTYQPRPQGELDRLGAIVQNAVGFDPQRSDQIEIYNTEFSSNNLTDDRRLLDSMYQREFYMEIGQKVGYGLLLVFVFLYAKKRAKKLFAALATLMPPAKAQVTQVEIEPVVEEEPAKAIIPKQRKPRLVDQMQETAKERPDEIARVIKTLMIE